MCGLCYNNFFLITSLIYLYLLSGFHKLFHFVRSTDVVVAPPFVYIDQVKSSITDRIEISAQNSWVGKGGAFTGEIRLDFSFLSKQYWFSFFFLCTKLGLLGDYRYIFSIFSNALLLFLMFKHVLFSGVLVICCNLASKLSHLINIIRLLQCGTTERPWMQVGYSWTFWAKACYWRKRWGKTPVRNPFQWLF